MKSLVKMLAVVEAVILLSVLGVAFSKHRTARLVHGPVIRPPLVAINTKVVERAKAWTVLISNEGFGSKARGTGMLIDANYVLTAAHMVPKNGNEMWIYIAPGRRIVRGKAVLEDTQDDLALVQLDEKVKLPAYATFQESHRDGQPIIIIGNILGGMQWYVSYGIISGNWGGDILMDGTMTHGDSGGPWINEEGEVVGMSDWQLGDEEPEASIKGGISAKKMRAFLGKYPRTEGLSVEVYTVQNSDSTKRKL